MIGQVLARVSSIGARGPLGLSATQIAMCVRARKNEPRSCGFKDKRGATVGLCSTGGLAVDLHGYDRMVELAAPALRDAYAAATPGRYPLVLAVAEPGRPDDDPRLAGPIVADLAALSGVPVDVGRSRVVRAGHAGGAVALEAAVGLLSSVPAVLVGGVDSYYHPGVIGWLDEECRLHGIDSEDGLVPSEGAAFLVLSQATAPGERPPFVTVSGVATGIEHTVARDEPNLASTMTALLRRVEPRAEAVRWVLTDQNGERHRALEWTQAALRDTLAQDAIVQRLVQDLGDIGAATGPMLATIAASWWRAGCAPAASVLVALHSEGAERGVFSMEASR